jgi:8-oxo-dGTP diphosphatase
METERVVTRAIIETDGKIILGKREHGYGVNQYALVGGKLDAEETLEQAIIREVKEETGLSFENPILWKEIPDSESIPGQIWHVYFFIGSARGQLILKEDEISEVIYVTEKDLDNLDIAFNHREILEEYFRERH